MISKKYILFFLALVSVHVIFAQSKVSLQGKITDAFSGEPLPGSTIYFPDLRSGTVSNDKGIYSFSNLAAGKYLAEISHIGYTSISEIVEVGINTIMDFKLDPTIVENEGVTVTGVSSATSVRRTPIPISILKRADLFKNISTNLVDNLVKVPGVSQVSTGPAISKPFIRGLGYNRVLVINDGVRQEGQQWGDEHGIEIDEQNVNKVEVLKGPASLMYGSDALAGVVNIISVVPAPEGKTSGNISGSYFTNNRQRNLHADVIGNQNGFIWGLNASYKAAADYQNKYDGHVFNSRFNENALGGYFGFNKKWGYSHFIISNFNQKLGLVEGERDPVTGNFVKLVNIGGAEQEVPVTNSDFKKTEPNIPKQHIQHFKISSDNSFTIGKNRLTMVLGYQRNQRKEFGDVLNQEQTELFFDLSTVTYNLQYHIVEKKDWKTTIGLNGMQQSNRNKGEEQIIPEYDLFDIGGFLYTQKRLDKLTLSGGIRIDNRSVNSNELAIGQEVKFPAFTKSFSNISGSAGLAYEASKIVTLKFNIARGFRAPGIPELASNGAHEGTNRFEYGSLSLKSETSLQTDAGIVVNSEHVSFTANVFYNPVRNFIYYSKLQSVAGGDSLISDGSDTYFAFTFKQGNAKLYGLEFNLDFHPHPLDWLHIENTFSYTRGKLGLAQDGSSNLPFIPAALLINELKVDVLKKGKKIRNLFIRAELDNTFSQNNPFTGFNTETATKGYSLLSAGFGAEIRNKEKILFNFYAGVNNITDVSYQNHLSRLKYAPENPATGRMGVFNMGRNISMKINMPLDFSKKQK
jgi:iron complex outermembrane recepter protein